MLETKRAFFSFGELTDRTKHREYNAWHQLDHRPENLALPAVHYGERFVCSPDCAEVRVAAEPPFENLHYFTYYLFREPVEENLRDFFALGAWTAQVGRGTELPYVKRPFGGQFLPLKAYANPRVLVGPEILPFRPTRGIYLHLWELPNPRSPEGQAVLAWYDQVHIPDLLTCKGVAGAWTFAADPAYAAPPAAALPWSVDRRVHLYFLDEDPLDFIADLRARVPEWRAAGRLRDNSRSLRNLFLGPLRTIIPWQWDWFD